MKKTIMSLIMCLPLLLMGQDASTLRQAQGDSTKAGIRWTEGLTWQQVKEKAKRENKYIFIDVYATWCTPCKKMDKEVYANDTVGNYYNDRFVCVKVQMDKTKQDNAFVQSWYTDAATIKREYKVSEFPTFIFLSSQSVVVEKSSGFKAVNDFLTLGKNALAPGKTYNDPYAEYDHLVAEYRKGALHYNRMPYMIRTAFQLEDSVLAKSLLRLHTDYVTRVTPEERYTKENIEFWTSFLLGSKTRIFQFFYKEGDKIDRAMNKKGYAAKVVDNTIMDEMVFPFLTEQNTDSLISITGMILTGPGLKTNYQEVDWKKLYREIQKSFNTTYAKRNLLQARIHWYERNRNYHAFAKYSLQYLKEYPPHDLKDWDVISKLNSIAWKIFLHTTDKQLIDEAIQWMKKIFDQNPNPVLTGFAGSMDTYANLLYKAGRTAEAVQWEEKAVTLRPEIEIFKEVVRQMKRGEPTHGAVWGYH